MGTVSKRYGFQYGALPMMLVLPPLVYWMWWCMVNHGGAMVLPGADFWRSIPLPTGKAVLIYGGWLLFQAALQQFMPGPWVEGQPLKDGSRLKYKMNGWLSWWATWGALALLVAVGHYRGGREGALSIATVLYDEFGPLMSVVNIFTILFCVYLYFRGKKHPDDGTRALKDEVSIGGGGVVAGPGGSAAMTRVAAASLPRVFYHYFMGTSLNPRNGTFDWKLFCEARPGLIGWVVLDFALAAKQIQLNGHLTTPMILVCFFHFWYIADYYFHEEAILTTWDIKHENFGWMLCWGDLVWVPFTYTLQALYLINHTHELSFWAVAGIILLNFAGFALFRGTNIQKHYFRKNPDAPLRWWNVRPEYIETRRGTRLLTNGFWGWARHLNYLGDLMMALAWCLPCGFENLLPYFYIIYFTILLVHRERRDNIVCADRYGEDWVRYCKKVRWRILPGIY